ncbi:hypothetical protein QFZ43_007970 [Streptomyces afghaniensis]|nr:hypothetical protein [Streptomyces afghaniensis]
MFAAAPARRPRARPPRRSRAAASRRAAHRARRAGLPPDRQQWPDLGFAAGVVQHQHQHRAEPGGDLVVPGETLLAGEPGTNSASGTPHEPSAPDTTCPAGSGRASSPRLSTRNAPSGHPDAPASRPAGPPECSPAKSRPPPGSVYGEAFTTPEGRAPAVTPATAARTAPSGPLPCCPPRDDTYARQGEAQEDHAGQNLGRGARSSTICAASASVSTDGGEPASGLLAVSFMHSTAMTPMTAAPVE